MIDIRGARRVLAAALCLMLVAGAAACGDDDDSETSGGGDSGDALKIALLLPETKTARYETQDRPLFEAKVADLCSDCEILYSNADQDVAEQQSQAEAALTNGADVLVLDPVDSATAGSIVAQAKAQDVPVVSYDRLITDAEIDFYISYDNEKVGELQATALVDKLESDGVTDGVVVMINGSPTANDGTAGGAIAAMKAAGVEPLPPVTGQDAELAAIQRILAGEQFMTVYKAIKPEAEIAAEVAIALAKGDGPPEEWVNQQIDNGQGEIPSQILDPVSVTVDNVNDTIVADGFWSVDEICEGDYAAACETAGIS